MIIKFSPFRIILSSRYRFVIDRIGYHNERARQILEERWDIKPMTFELNDKMVNDHWAELRCAQRMLKILVKKKLV